MKKGKICLLAAAVWLFCGPQSAGAEDTIKTPVESEQPAGQPVAASEESQTWQAAVYGDDWAVEREKIGLLVPEFAQEQAVPATDLDRKQLSSLPEDTAINVTRALERYYFALDKLSIGYAGRKFQLTAARILDGYVLLWLDEPDILDGGRALIYSVAKDKIVADFSDGGIRG